ncbi:MAG: DUF692 domain-containing protein [Planctomycetota bacterium]|nr:DUF692 domain-containing protein [Planctomycetota bacterium]
MKAPRFDLPALGVGIGLRTTHYGRVLAERPAIDWFEVITENYLSTGGRPLRVLEQVAERYPVVFHGVSLSIGSTDPLDRNYLAQVKDLAARIHPHWISDHLCWTGVAGRNVHDLLPLPYTEECLRHVVARVRQVQDILERPIALENPSSYVQFRASQMSEAEFLARMAEDADCALLLDVNNVYVSSRNHDFDPVAYVDALPAERVVQFHVAGHTDKGTHLLDTHSGTARLEVWDLLRHALERTGPRAVLYEWDEDIPDLDVVHAEALRARAFLQPSTRGAAHAAR